MNKTTIFRIVLVLITFFFIVWILFLNYTDLEFKVESFIVGPFAFYPTFTIENFSMILFSILVYGIFVLPFIINELGFLGDENELPEFGLAIEKNVDAIIERTKTLYNRVKIWGYHIVIGLLFVAIPLMTLPTLFLEDGEQIVWDKYLEEFVLEPYFGYIRGFLLVVGLVLIVTAIIIYWRLRAD